MHGDCTYDNIVHIGLGDDGFPLLMQPLLVGFEQDWISVSPLAMFAWVCTIVCTLCVLIECFLHVLCCFYALTFKPTNFHNTEKHVKQ